MAHERNLAEAERLISASPESDLYVLPEMWDTGFVTDGRTLSESHPEKTLSAMQDLARRRNAAVCGSIAIPDEASPETEGNRKYRNRLYFVRPDKSMEWYDKRHLFRHGGEEKDFLRGDRRVTVAWKGWRLLLLTCYDLRFPSWSRWREDYEAIIVAANWPQSRALAWDTLTRARAIENECFVIACNRTGSSSQGQYMGHSSIIGPDGTTLAEGYGHGAQCITAEIGQQALTDYRERFRFLEDRDHTVLTV